MATLARISDYAREHHVTERAIRQAIDSGLIPPPPRRGFIDRDQAEATWGRRHRARQAERDMTAASEERRDMALLTTVAAKVATTRQRAAALRAALVERDAAQAVIGGLVERLMTALPEIVADAATADRALLAEALDMMGADLGDLRAEALKVTRG